MDSAHRRWAMGTVTRERAVVEVAHQTAHPIAVYVHFGLCAAACAVHVRNQVLELLLRSGLVSWDARAIGSNRAVVGARLAQLLDPRCQSQDCCLKLSVLCSLHTQSWGPIGNSNWNPSDWISGLNASDWSTAWWQWYNSNAGWVRLSTCRSLCHYCRVTVCATIAAHGSHGTTRPHHWDPTVLWVRTAPWIRQRYDSRLHRYTIPVLEPHSRGQCVLDS